MFYWSSVGPDNRPKERIMNPLHTRKVGRTTLAVYAAERAGTGLGGRTLARPTGYAVVALANRSRERVTLAVCETLDTATEYVNTYSPAYGLVTKG